MKDNNQGTWVGVEHLNNDPALKDVINQEFVELPVVNQLSSEKVLDTSSSRRDFLKYLGFGLGVATVAACDIPVRKALPYVVKPDEIVPGVATYYASTFVKGGDYCPVLVKTREGRPIKVEGNTLSSVTKGGTNARTQASVLDLYDTSRIAGPSRIKAQAIEKTDVALTWEQVDAEIMAKLSPSEPIRIISNTVLSPSTKRVIEDFKAKYPDTKHVMYDAISSSAILEANAQTFGQQAIPDYHFDKAEVIVSVGADFLGTWISPIEYAADYAVNRKIEDVKNAKMSRLIHVESFMSLTGSNADTRIVIKPSEQGAAIATLYNAVAGLTASNKVNAPKLEQLAASEIEKAAKELVAHKGKSLVVSGSNNVGEQILVNAINQLLGNYGNTLDFQHASLLRQGIDSEITNVINELNVGKVKAVIFLDDCNPVFDLPKVESEKLKSALGKVETKISFATTFNDTAALCDYVLPTHNYLEAWGDAEPKRGVYSLIQPTIAPLFKTRQAEVTLLTWAQSPNLNKESEQPYFDYIKQYWETEIAPKQTIFNKPQLFWDNTLHDGVVEIKPTGDLIAPVAALVNAVVGTTVPNATIDVAAAAQKINQPFAGDKLEIALFEDVKMGAGQYANNPWLQELPEPVTRCTWGNYVQIPVSWDGNRSFVGFDGLNGNEIYGEADKIKLTANGAEGVITAIRAFGVKANTMAVSLGYGRGVVGKSGENIGTNVFPWVNKDKNGNFQYFTDAEYGGKQSEDKLACVQYHHSLGLQGDDNGEKINLDEKAVTTLREGYQGALTNTVVIRRANLKELDRFIHGEHHEGDESGHHGSMKPFAENYMGLIGEREHHNKLNSYTLYPGYEYQLGQGHHWGMHVDLNACIGCGACAVACTAENNIPVVGKNEVARHHEMAWIRIDRYYYGDAENPNVVYQPMMCQHCDNAPCENVCPVAATPHSEEGLNQMAYNRCIGTRYCANNCPYKVRRFNWLDYTTADLFPMNERTINGEEIPFGADNLTRMVLNPDVTVRSRGVIEKCSFCVQRIQAGKLTAKRESRRLRDADVRTACQTACPTGAITFGDMNDKNGELSKKFASELNYRVLEQVNTQSSVQYAVRVVNKPDAELVYASSHSNEHGADDKQHG